MDDDGAEYSSADDPENYPGWWSLTWSDPPPLPEEYAPTFDLSQLPAVAALLATRPMTWALVIDGIHSQDGPILARNPVWTEHGLEVVSAPTRQPDGLSTSGVWARYVGSGGDQA